jgi:hypothetical protein
VASTVASEPDDSKSSGLAHYRREPGARRWWPTVTGLVALAVGASLLLPAGRHQWALSLIRQPTPYTVLFFNKPAALPTTDAIDKQITVSFTVGNHEGRLMDFRYVLSVSSGRDSRILEESTRPIAPGAMWTVTRRFRPRCSISPCRIEVSLPGHPETIDFLLSGAIARGGGAR